jgi:hypothetical protein
MTQHMKLNGICYQPAPSDFYPGHNAYFDSDYYNDDFEHLWSQRGRSDLQIMKEELDINFLHLYNWCTVRNHEAFLEECAKFDIKVGIPISNYTLGLVREGKFDLAEENVRNIINQTISFAPNVVMMWFIGNEYELEGFSIEHVMKVIELVVKYDLKGLPFAIPISYKNQSIPTLREIHYAFSTNYNHLSDRLIMCVNIFNKGDDISKFVNHIYAPEFSNIPLMLGEYGKDSFNVSVHEQAEWVEHQVKTVFEIRNNTSYFLGGCLFEWSEEHWKPQEYDKYFGLLKLSQHGHKGTTKRCGHQYPIDQYEKKPVYDRIASVIKSYRKCEGTSSAVMEPIVSYETLYPSMQALQVEQKLPPPPPVVRKTEQKLPPPPVLPRAKPTLLPPPPKLNAGPVLPPPPKILPPPPNVKDLV